MPVSIVIGGQFGSEGKGKTALEIVRRSHEAVVVARVGGPNVEHTSYDRSGTRHTLRQLPASCVDGDVDVVFPAGSYIDVDLLAAEMKTLNLSRKRVSVSPFARVITSRHREWEQASNLINTIGLTGSGVCGAVMASVARGAASPFLHSPCAADDSKLEGLVADVSGRLRRDVESGARVVVEGSHGFGVSLLDGGCWPHATARCTTAAGALAEAGLSPVDVDDVTMAVRSFPIREAGDTGPLVGETTWEAIAAETDHPDIQSELTLATGLARRVAHFDPKLVRRALDANRPTRLVLNHLDHIGNEQDLEDADGELRQFIRKTEADIGRRVDWLGFSGDGIVERPAWEA